MSTQRYISTSFWVDPWVETLKPQAKLLFMYLLTNPLTNIAGVYQLTIKRIGDETGLSKAFIQETMKEFEAKKKAAFVGDYIILSNWPKHQKLTSADTRAGIDRVIAELPEEVRDALPRVGYAYSKTTTPQPNDPQGGTPRPPTGPLPAPQGGPPPTLTLTSTKTLPSGLAREDSPETERAQALHAFCLRIACEERNARNPEALAKTLEQDPAIIARFEASLPSEIPQGHAQADSMTQAKREAWELHRQEVQAMDPAAKSEALRKYAQEHPDNPFSRDWLEKSEAG